MKYKILFLLFAINFSIACVSTHPGKMAKPVSQEEKLSLKMSAQKMQQSGSKAFQLVEVTFENTSDAWLRVNKSEIIMDEELNGKVSVVVGEDLVSWGKAMQLQIKKDQHNSAVAQSIILGVGMAAAGSSSDSAAASAGLAMMAGGYIWAASDAIGYAIDKAQHVEKVPLNHLYKSFSVPGLMVARRWLLINKPLDYKLNKLSILVETVEGEKEVYEIKL